MRSRDQLLRDEGYKPNSVSHNFPGEPGSAPPQPVGMDDEPPEWARRLQQSLDTLVELAAQTAGKASPGSERPGGGFGENAPGSKGGEEAREEKPHAAGDELNRTGKTTLQDDTSYVWGLQGGDNQGDVETSASDASASIKAARERTRKRRESRGLPTDEPEADEVVETADTDEVRTEGGAKAPSEPIELLQQLFSMIERIDTLLFQADANG